MADLFFDNIVCFRSERFHGVAGGIESIGKNHSPACALLRVNSGGDDCGTSASGKQGGKRRSRSEASEERRPKAVVASMLVAQNADPAARAQQFDHWLESVFAIKKLQTGTATCAAHMGVDEAIAKLLIYARISNITHKLWHQLRKQFPSGEMTQNEDHRNAGAKSSIHGLDVFDCDSTQDFFRRHRAELDTAQKVRAQLLKMATDKTAQLRRRLFTSERDGNVAL